MLRLVYIYRNLTRNAMRTWLTCAAVALPIIIYVLSTAVISGINEFLENSAKQLRLAVTHKTSIINPLPLGHRVKIESLDPTGERILSVCGVSWIGGRIEDDSRPLSTLAAQEDTFAETFNDYLRTPEELDAWQRNPQAIILGSSTASQFGWKVGDRITILPGIPPYTPLEFKVISTAEDATDPVTNFCRMDYLQETFREAMRGAGTAMDEVATFFFVKCASKEDLDYFRVAIDAMFANTPDETKTQDEKSFMNEYISQQFNLPRNLTILAAVTIFVAVMAAANTMSMNIRDRINEVAVLRSIGFSSRLVFAFVQLESLVLCGLGGFLGAAGPFVAFNHTPLKDMPVPLIQSLIVKASVCGEALLVALLIGVLAAAWPSYSAARMTIVSALRNIE